MAKTHFTIPKLRLSEFCRRWQVTELALFGSVLRGDFHSDSDVDTLACFAPEARWSLRDEAYLLEPLISARKTGMRRLRTLGSWRYQKGSICDTV